MARRVGSLLGGLAALALACDHVYAVRGAVLRPDGSPVEGATVSMRRSCDSDKAASTALTTADGSYRVGFMGGFRLGQGPATWWVDVSKEGYERRCVARKIDGNQDEPFPIELRPTAAGTTPAPR